MGEEGALLLLSPSLTFPFWLFIELLREEATLAVPLVSLMKEFWARDCSSLKSFFDLDFFLNAAMGFHEENMDLVVLVGFSISRFVSGVGRNAKYKSSWILGCRRVLIVVQITRCYYDTKYK